MWQAAGSLLNPLSSANTVFSISASHCLQGWMKLQSTLFVQRLDRLVGDSTAPGPLAGPVPVRVAGGPNSQHDFSLQCMLPTTDRGTTGFGTVSVLYWSEFHMGVSEHESPVRLGQTMMVAIRCRKLRAPPPSSVPGQALSGHYVPTERLGECVQAEPRNLIAMDMVRYVHSALAAAASVISLTERAESA